MYLVSSYLPQFQNPVCATPPPEYASLALLQYKMVYGLYTVQYCTYKTVDCTVLYIY